MTTWLGKRMLRLHILAVLAGIVMATVSHAQPCDSGIYEYQMVNTKGELDNSVLLHVFQVKNFPDKEKELYSNLFFPDLYSETPEYWIASDSYVFKFHDNKTQSFYLMPVSVYGAPTKLVRPIYFNRWDHESLSQFEIAIQGADVSGETVVSILSWGNQSDLPSHFVVGGELYTVAHSYLKAALRHFETDAQKTAANLFFESFLSASGAWKFSQCVT